MSKERFEWLYNETMLKHYMVDNQNNIQLGYEAIVNLLNQQNKQIADLEAKLAESEKNVEFYKERYSDATTSAYGADLIAKNIQSRLEEEIRELKQQLAEKDKKQKRTNKVVKQFQQRLKYFSEQDQDKIEFAIEQLEQLRHDIWTNQADDGYTDMQVDLYDLNDTIDVRIIQIKEGK